MQHAYKTFLLHSQGQGSLRTIPPWYLMWMTECHAHISYTSHARLELMLALITKEKSAMLTCCHGHAENVRKYRTSVPSQWWLQSKRPDYLKPIHVQHLQWACFPMKHSLWNLVSIHDQWMCGCLCASISLKILSASLVTFTSVHHQPYDRYSNVCICIQVYCKRSFTQIGTWLIKAPEARRWVWPKSHRRHFPAPLCRVLAWNFGYEICEQ